MAGDKRQLELDLLANNKMGTATEAAARDLGRVGDAADKAGHKAEEFGKDSLLAGEGAEALGKAATTAKDHVERLDHEINKAKQDLVFLAASFAAAGSAAERLDISKGIRRTENDLRRLTKSKGILDELLPDPEPAVQSWAGKLAGTLRTAVPDALAGGGMGQAGAIVGAALAPTIGAGIAGAVTGGVGLGGVIGGLALAAKNPAVKAQAGAIGHTFMAGITAEANQAFAGPLQASLGKLSALAARSVPKIGQVFANTAPSVGKLTDALVHAGDALLDGFVYASAKSGPALQSLGKLIAGVGSDAANFIKTMADHSAEGASAIDDLTGSLHSLVTTASGVVSGLASLKGVQDGIDKWIDDKRSWLEDHTHFLDLTADGYKRGSAAAKLYRQGVIGAAGSVNDYNHYLAAQAAGTGKAAAAMGAAARAASTEATAMGELNTVLHKQTDPLFALISAQSDVTKAQKSYTAAVKAHGPKSEQAREAAIALAKATVGYEGAAAGAADSTGKLDPKMLAVMRAAHMTKGQIAAVAAALKDAKRRADAFSGKYYANLYYKIHYNRVYSNSAAGADTISSQVPLPHRAAGGPVRKHMPYLVGENGPELMVPDANGRILSNAATRAATRAGGGGRQPVDVHVTVTHDVTGADSEMKRLIRKMIRTEGL
jgi:hypothetical protein